MKSVRLEWVLGNVGQAKDLLKDALSKYDNFSKVWTKLYLLYDEFTLNLYIYIFYILFLHFKLWMMKGQIHEEAKETYEATQAYRNGVRYSFMFFHRKWLTDYN